MRSSDEMVTPRFARRADQPGPARAFVRHAPDGRAVDGLMTLMARELVTNAVIHGTADVVLSAHASPSRIHIEVARQ
jgi:anti-sigma regulatory factor (Ser/Thr protein kinase)